MEADYQLLQTSDKVFAYKRQLGREIYLVVVNLSNQEQFFEESLHKAQVVISNTDMQAVVESQQLEPWDAFCVKLDETCSLAACCASAQ